MALYKELVKKISIQADKKTKLKEYLPSGELPIVDQGQELIGGYSNDRSKAVSCDYPVIVFGDHTKCVKYINFPFGAGADGIKVLQPKESIDPKYLYYGTKYLTYSVRDKGYARHYQYIEKMDLILPPIKIQKKIVKWLDELFSELDKAVETLKTAKEQLAVYRQAVLKEAFDFNNMDRCTEIAALVDDIRIGPFGTALHKSDYIKSGIPVINPQHIKKGKIKSTPNVTVSVEKAEVLSSYKLKVNDIIMGRRGEMGRAAAVTEAEIGWLCGTGSMLFRMKPEYDAGLYAQIISSPDVVHYLEEHATGTTMKNLNESIVKHIPVPVITREKQKQIMGKIGVTMSVCDSIEKTVETALQQAEAMRQSVLKKAFSGEL